MIKFPKEFPRIVLILSVVLNVLLVLFFLVGFFEKDTKPEGPFELEYVQQTDELTYYLSRDKVFKEMPNDTNEIIMLGNSLTHNFEWKEMFPDVNIKNRGINGDIIPGLVQRIQEVTDSRPLKIFIEIGINDIQQGFNVEEIMEKYVILIQKIEEQSPATKIYIQNILPTNVRLYGTKHKINDIILEVNKLLESYCKQAHITYIDLYSNFNDNGKLKLKYDCGDHLHLSGYGYIEWCRIIQEYVYE